MNSTENNQNKKRWYQEGWSTFFYHIISLVTFYSNSSN